MSEKQKQVMEGFEKVLPRMTDLEMARLIGYGEGLAAREDRQKEATPTTCGQAMKLDK